MKKIYFLAIIATLFFFPHINSSAKSYDAYVDKGYDKDDADGSSDKPYKTIEKAIEKLGSKGGSIYVENGTYTETLSLKKDMDLFGQSKNKTIIQGTITTEGNNKIEDLTISGGSYGISALGKIEVSNCKIRNSSKIGIDLLGGDKEASISNSTISGNGKGIYVQRKRSISISGNSVYGNKEEGIDLREKINGTITKNEIFENGEGGIEVILGGSTVKISNNSIKKNKASGIASQFYSFIEKTGSINITNNNLSNNGHFGLTCGIPSGGKPSAEYWKESIELRENTIENNKKGAVNEICNMMQVVDEEEEKENIIKDEVSESEVEEEKENEETKEQIIREQLDEQIKAGDLLISSSSQNLETLSNRNFLSVFFFGIKTADLDSIKNNVKEIESQIFNAKNIIQETKNTENLDLANATISKLESELEKNNQFLEKREGRFSLLGWLINLF